MNYVSVPMLVHAAQTMAAMERLKAERPGAPGGLTCGWEPGPGSPPCGEPAEYFVPDGTRVSAGGDIETLPMWYCEEHLERELGAPVERQPMFGRIEGFDAEE